LVKYPDDCCHKLTANAPATGLDYDNLDKGLAVTKATLFSKEEEEKFSANLSERIVSLADIYSYIIFN